MPSMECPVYEQQIKSLEKVQRRAVQIIVGNTSHTEASSTLGIQSLADRHSELCRTLFTQIVNNKFHSLHYLLSVKRDTQLIGQLHLILHSMRGPIDLKIRAYPFAYLTISDTSDILFYCVCCACV